MGPKKAVSGFFVGTQWLEMEAVLFDTGDLSEKGSRTVTADGSLFGQIIFRCHLQGSFSQLRAVKMGFRKLTYLLHDADHIDFSEFLDLPVAGKHRRCFKAGLAERAAIGPGGGIADPAILELQGDFHGVATVAGNSGAAVRVFDLFIGEIMKTKPAQGKQEKDEKGEQNVQNFHGD